MLKLKKVMASILTGVMVLSMSANAFAADAVTIKMDGKDTKSAVAPQLENGTALVSLKFLEEYFGADVSYGVGSGKATVKTTASSFTFTADSTSYTLNGNTKTLATAPIRSGSTLLVPLNDFATGVGAKAKLSGTTMTVDYFSDMSGNIKITGSTTLQPFVQKAADRLIKLNKGLKISVAGGGSGAGVNDTAAGTNNIGMSSRELTDSELKKMMTLSVARDGIAIIAHPSNPVKNLTAEQAKKIFLGEIKNWKEVGGNDAPILVQVRETGSGTRTTFEELLLEKKASVKTATPHTSSAILKQAVAKEKNAIGYDSAGFVDETVKTVFLDNAAPTASSVKNGTYALGRELFLLSKAKPTGVNAKFIDYIKTAEVQNEVVSKEGYMKLK